MSELGRVRLLHATRIRVQSMWLPIIVIVIYLITRVANGECYQGIANGWLTTNNIPYNKPAFLTWYSYCFMLLSLLILYPYVQWYTDDSFRHFLFCTWPGKLGFRNAFCSCLAMMYLLIVINILWVFGLDRISVSIANAVIQTQTGMTVALSVWILGDRFVFSQGLGIVVSLFGVLLIVVTPLYNKGADHGENHTSGSELIGIFLIIASSLLWAGYQLSWRILSETKNNGKLTRADGLIDTLASVAVMGFCNLVLGWPAIVLFHWTGLETFEYPSIWMALTLNGLVEYSFDVSCAFAIFLTSPVVTAITAPLTIPISLIWDSFMYKEPFYVGTTQIYGVLFVLLGVTLVELKPTRWENFCAAGDDENRVLLQANDETGTMTTFEAIPHQMT